MTEKRLRELSELWRSRLGLDGWLIELRVEAASDEDCYMEVERSVYYERASLVVQPWVLGKGKPPDTVLIRDLTDRFIEISLVHELLHLVVRDMAMVLREDLDGCLHRDVFAQIDNAFRRAEEQAVDRLATSLVASWS